jgi:hypothetical protein
MQEEDPTAVEPDAQPEEGQDPPPDFEPQTPLAPDQDGELTERPPDLIADAEDEDPDEQSEDDGDADDDDDDSDDDNDDSD